MTAPSDLRVPQRYRDPLKTVLSLTDEDLERVKAHLERATPFASRAQVVESLEKSQLPDAVSSDSLSVALIAVHTLRVAREADAEEIAYQLSVSPDLELADDERVTFVSRWQELLQIRAVEAIAKAVDVQTDYDRVFLDARLFIEVRPVFGDDPDDEPSGVVISHMLQISYQEDGRRRSFSVAIDNNDLGSLSRVLSREESKSKSVTDMLDSADIFVFRPEEE